MEAREGRREGGMVDEEARKKGRNGVEWEGTRRAIERDGRIAKAR